MTPDPTTWPAWAFIAFIVAYALVGGALAGWERWTNRRVDDGTL